ncbi:MAG: hypothetical protein ACXVJD_03995 [Mucilaginibacter sp.]
MKRTLLAVCSMVISVVAFGQNKSMSGRIIDSATQVPVNGVTVILKPGNRTDVTDETGRFFSKI